MRCRFSARRASWRPGEGGCDSAASILTPLSGRFIHQVNQAAVTIQRWYRHQVQRRRAGAARLERLLASKREVSVGVRATPRGVGVNPRGPAVYGRVSDQWA